jgi:hypothetical protein
MQYGVILNGKTYYPDTAPTEQPANTCALCGNPLPKSQSITPGYALTERGERVCYPCAAKIEETSMEQTGQAILYLTKDYVTNWTGILRFPILRRCSSHHNLGGTRIDIWFRDKQGHMWHGIHIGHSHELVRCRKLRK